MSVSTVLEKSARDFCLKYACDFDFTSFEALAEEFTFLRPVGGWAELYKTTFDKLYKSTLEKASVGLTYCRLDAEAMLDDFEYTLIRPYINEGNKGIEHRPYAGMDRISRLEYLNRLTKEAPSNAVDLYAEKYKKGELSIKQIKSQAGLEGDARENCVALVGYAQALEAVNNSRSVVWRVFHPFKNNAEKRTSETIKKLLTEETRDGEEFYQKNVTAAYEPFDSLQKVKLGIEQNMIHAREEMSRSQRMKDVIRESIHIDDFERESSRELSPRVEPQARSPEERKYKR